MALLLIVFAALFLRSVRDSAYERGRDDAAEQYREIVEAKDQENRAQEQAAQRALDALGKRVEATLIERDKIAAREREVVEKLVERQPDCAIDPEIIAAKNRARQ